MELEKILNRIAPLDNEIVSHPLLMNAYNGISRCVAMTKAFREPMGSLLLAPSGLGKTTICNMLLKAMPSSIVEEDSCTRKIIPAFYAEVPASTRVSHLATNILKELNDPSPSAGEIYKQTDRIVTLLKSCETQLVMLDEFHHLVKEGARSVSINTKTCNWIKSLVNKSGVSFCLVGLPKIASILTLNEELAGRIPMRYELRQFYPGSKNKPGELEIFLNSLGMIAIQKIGLKGFPPGDDALFANQVYAATQGIPRYIGRLMRVAITISLSSGSEWVDKDDFALAWDSGICVNSSLLRENPFRLDGPDLARLMKASTK